MYQIAVVEASTPNGRDPTKRQLSDAMKAQVVIVHITGRMSQIAAKTLRMLQAGNAPPAIVSLFNNVVVIGVCAALLGGNAGFRC